MGEFFNFINIIFVVVVVLIFLRLRQVLGRRTGHERPPADRFSGREANRDGADKKSTPRLDNVLDIPARKPSQKVKAGTGQAEDGADDDSAARRAAIEKRASANSPLRDGLQSILDADPSFDVDNFLRGAGMAYEMIVMAFAEGDRKTLKAHLSAEVFSGFVEAVSARERSQHSIKTTFVGILKSEPTDASLLDNMARVTVRFESELITATYDGSDALIEGDPNKVSTIVDVWTFARSAASRDPNWKLVATASSE